MPLRRAQEVTQARDSAEAHRKLAATKLAQARANQTQIEVAKRSLEAAQKATQKAAQEVDLAETGDAEIREVELLTAVKKQNVMEARRSLTSAEDQLKYTEVRAPISGVVVKRYRHLGDFASAGVPILSMYDPDLALRDGQFGGDATARRRAGQPGGAAPRRFRRAVPRPRRLDQ